MPGLTLTVAFFLPFSLSTAFWIFFWSQPNLQTVSVFLFFLAAAVAGSAAVNPATASTEQATIRNLFI